MSGRLEATEVTVRYGGVVALDRVSVTVAPGEIVGLIGPNGAGKTTLFECIAGFRRPDGGRVRLDGADITGAPPERRARIGLIRSFQDARLFPSLTVFQTVLVAQEKHRPSSLAGDVSSWPGGRRAERQKAEAADRLIESMGLSRFRDKLISELSTGTRRITELACAVSLEPTVLLLDEPSSGIAQREVEALGDLLRRIKQITGCTMLVIEHDMPLITSLSDRIVALESGRFLVEGPPAEVIAHPEVVASYLGTSAATINRSGHVPDRRRRRRPPTPSTAPAEPAPALPKGTTR